MGPVKTLTRHPDYSATKLALHSTAATVVQELGNSGVTCNILMSGLYESEALLNMFHRIARENGIAPDAPDMLPQVLKIIGSTSPWSTAGRPTKWHRPPVPWFPSPPASSTARRCASTVATPA